MNYSFYIILIFPLMFTSCLNEEADGQPKMAARTVLVYLAGDNGLGEEAQKKLDSLVAAWSVAGENNHLLVYQDCGKSSLPSLMEIVRSKNGEAAHIEVLEEYEQENSASQATFIRVLNKMEELFPAADYGLVVFSEASGWLPENFYVQSRSIAMDNNKELELRDFAKSIPDGRFSFIIFESSLMAGVEVAYELKNKTDYILASSAEILSPGFSPLYGKMLPLIFAETPKLKEFAEEYYNYYKGQDGVNRSATISLIKTSELTPLKKIIANAEANVERWEWVEREHIQVFDRKKEHLFYDLAGYIASVGTEKEVLELDSVLSKSIIYQAATETFLGGEGNMEGGFNIRNHCGLTIYIPVNRFGYINRQRELLKLFSIYIVE